MPPSKGIIFCNAFPVSKASYDEALATRAKDFVHHFGDYYSGKTAEERWALYEKEIINPYETFKKAFITRGFEFTDECTFTNYTKIVKDVRYNTIIIFSHCINNETPEEQIEFFDEMVSSIQIVKSLLNIERIYDFSVCRSTYLAGLMKAEINNAVCGSTNLAIPVTIWLYIYAELFKDMQVNGSDYLESMYNLKKQYIQLEHGKKIN